MFSGYSSVSGCVRPGVLGVSTISYKPLEGMEFHQTLVDDVVEATGDVIRF